MSNLTILWIDDMRNPETYFKKKLDKTSGTLYNNITYYNKIFNKYNVHFIWVKSFDEFVSFIEANGLPQFISFDHDLGKGKPKGLDCAKWLVRYCNQKGLKLPKFFVHSANPNGQREINAILHSAENKNLIKLNESNLRDIVKRCVNLLSEGGVYMDRTKQNDKKRTIGLTYNNTPRNNKNSLTSADNLKTDLMDIDNEHTYEVPLKGGIISYNITEIHGQEVMHFFKRLFKGQDTEFNINGNPYKIKMEKNEEEKFLSRFQKKIEYVINYYGRKMERENKEFSFNKVSIYPVPSSSNFNLKIANLLSNRNLLGLPIQVIDSNLLKKDLSNLQRDEDFISKNKDFYNSRYSNQDTETVNTFVNSILSRNNTLQSEKLLNLINTANYYYKRIIHKIYNNKAKGILNANNLLDDYLKYYEAVNNLKGKNFQYLNAKGNLSYIKSNQDIVQKLKGTKNPSVDKNTDYVWQIIKPLVREKGIKKIPIQQWEKPTFQIKNFSNGERMALKNLFQKNKDAEFVENELKRIKGSLFIIFDDNISGGSTLSDICYQCQQMGIENIIPITFGKMSEKYTMRGKILTQPINNRGEKGKFNYSE